MNDNSREPRRRWFQFSLRTLLIVVTLAPGLLVAWRAYVEPYRRQRETMNLIEELGGECTLEPAEKWLRWMYGDDFQNVVLVDVADCDDPGKYLEQVAELPQLKTLVVGGLTFTDECLCRLKEVKTLRGLVIDSTSVTDDGIKALNELLPDLVVRKSQRRVMVFITNLDGEYKTEPRGPIWLRGLLNDHCQNIIEAWLSTEFSDADLAHLRGLKGLTNLQTLGLSSTQVSDAGLAHLKELTNLKKLRLTRTQVTDAGLKHLKGVTNLQKLYLGGTQVSDAGLAHLKGLRNLQYLGLVATLVTDAGVDELQKALPNCYIYRLP